MWNGFKTKRLYFAERSAVIVYPKGKGNGKMILKTEYFDAFPSFDIAMLEKGYHVIFISHYNRWATDEELDIAADFVRKTAEELDADECCILEGMSCGGLFAAKFAAKYPELTNVLYLDAPVLNILSLAGLGMCRNDAVAEFRREIVNSYKIAESEFVNFRESAIDNLKPLTENNIAVIMLYGNADDVVLYNENGKILEDFYNKNNGKIKVISKTMSGHHPHCLDDPTVIVEFVEQNLKIKEEKTE